MTDIPSQTLLTPRPEPVAPVPRGTTPRPPRRSAKWWGVPLMAVACAVLVTIAVAAMLPAELFASKDVPDPDREGAIVEEATPYAIVPAAVEAVAERVSYSDLTDDVAVDTDIDGRVYFVTIREPAQSALGWWVGRDHPEIQFLTHEEKYGSQTPTQRRTVAMQQMRTSSQVAQFVALTLAGYDPELVPGPVQVEQMLCLEVEGSRCAEYVASAEQLDDGDLIRAVDGEPVATIDELSAALATHAPGDTVSLTIERPDEGEVTVDVELIAAPDDPDRAIIGFLPFDTDSVRLPFEIEIDSGEIGGPSAGLAFTLTLLDELTGGDLLGGIDVAVTGTINIDGTVGAIGGLPQKASAVRQAGIDHFLVPANQSPASLEAAREVVGGDVELIPVADVDTALAALQRLGGDPVDEIAAE